MGSTIYLCLVITLFFTLGTTYFTKADHHAPPVYPRTSPDHDHRRSSSSHHQPVIKYEGPIVYSDEKPPIIHFPSPPRSNEEGGSVGISRHHQAVKYVPLPHHDLPVLIYQSEKQPPIHVVHQPIHTKKQQTSKQVYSQPKHQVSSSNSLLYGGGAHGAQSKASSAAGDHHHHHHHHKDEVKSVAKYPKHPRPFGPQTKKETYRDNNSQLNKAAWLKNQVGYQQHPGKNAHHSTSGSNDKLASIGYQQSHGKHAHHTATGSSEKVPIGYQQNHRKHAHHVATGSNDKIQLGYQQNHGKHAHHVATGSSEKVPIGYQQHFGENAHHSATGSNDKIQLGYQQNHGKHAHHVATGSSEKVPIGYQQNHGKHAHHVATGSNDKLTLGYHHHQQQHGNAHILRNTSAINKPSFGPPVSPFNRQDEDDETTKKAIKLQSKNPFILNNKKHRQQPIHQYGPAQKPTLARNKPTVSNRHPVYIKAPQAPVPVYINNPSKPIYAEPKKDSHHEEDGSSNTNYLNNLSSSSSSSSSHHKNSYLTTKLRTDNQIISPRPTTVEEVVTTTTHAPTTTQRIITSTAQTTRQYGNNHLLRSALPSQKVKIQEVIGIVQHGNSINNNNNTTASSSSNHLQTNSGSLRQKANIQRLSNNNNVYPHKSSYVPPKPTYKPKPTRQPKPKPVYKPSPAAPHIIYAGHPPIHIYEQPAAVLETAQPAVVTTQKPIIYKQEQKAKKQISSASQVISNQHQDKAAAERSEDHQGVKKQQQYQKKLTYSAKSPSSQIVDYNIRQPHGPHRHKSAGGAHRFNSQGSSRNHHQHHHGHSNRKEAHQASPPPRPTQNNSNNPVYIPAPKAFHKPPIIIYQGFVPPVHVFKESQGYTANQGVAAAAPRIDVTKPVITSSISNSNNNVPNRSFKRGIVEDIIN